MTPGYKDAKAKLSTLSGPEQEAFLRRILERKQALTKAAQPWPMVAIMAWLAGILVFAASAAREERSWFLLGLGLVFAAGFADASALHDAAHDQRHAIAFPCH